MAANNRALLHDEPPPYLEAPGRAHPTKRFSFAESLPEYTAKPKVAIVAPPKQSFFKRTPVWICGGILIVVAVLAGTLGGLFGHKHSKSSPTISYGNGTNFGPRPDFLALAAAECDPITFVIYQKNDMENTTLYLRAETKSGTWNGTSSSVLNETVLHLNPPNSPAVNTNITAVCWRDTDNTVDLRIYYISAALSGSLNRIMEAYVSLEYPSQTLSPIQAVSNPEVTRVRYVTGVPSIAAVLLAPYAIRLYYLDTFEVGEDMAMVFEVNRTETTGWSDPLHIIPAYTYSSHAPLTASAVNGTSGSSEIHLLYMNPDHTLEWAKWNETGWNARPVLSSNNRAVSIILGMSSIIESTNPTVLRLFYLQRVPHVYDMSISPVWNGTSENGVYTDNGVINAPSYNAFPIVTTNPALIAAISSGSNSTSDMAQVFFVRGSYRWMQSGPNTAILNATVPVNGTRWSVSTLGQDPNSPPDSTMQMPN
ncbi:uncharacterized protein PAC_04562 [Phialocephala subalpina]|uniref:Fucose-specific lectin n=1 Tax=Phialocephala subalpina TaxID=576137 RepID=A0A1L7WPI0_9HELO|nr:uncharacterized protein PAC_04562 [Phialocephala subalpina]